MAFVIKYIKKIRNNWKKSTFAAIALTYGYNYADEYFETQALMRDYCKKAEKYGREPLKPNENPRSIAVILNPNANKRKATKEFEKYCAPILHLAGIGVEILKTESEGHAKKLIETLNGVEALVVAGGDGTLSEVVTGLLRRTGEHTGVPIGVLPLGRSNVVAINLFPGGHNVKHIRSLVDAAFAVVEGNTKPVDVLRIEVSSENEETENKPVYALAGIKWGAYRDAEAKKDSYWYFGSLRKYATYLFNGFRDTLTWNCKAEINYSLPCLGCSNCIEHKPVGTSIFQRFLKSNNSNGPLLPVNPECKTIYDRGISTTDLVLLTSNAIPSSLKEYDSVPKLYLNIGPKKIDYLSFVKEGWGSENGEKRNFEEVIEAREVIIKPKTASNSGKEQWFSIDNENFEVKPIKVTLLPKCLNMFCKKEI